jgi:glycosyltransferase involved in cell wall biosynthesis
MSYKGSFYRKYLIHRLCKKFGKKDIIHLHGSEFKKFFEDSSSKTKVKIRTLLRECDSMIVLGEEWNKRIKEIEPSTKTIIVSNTVKIPQKTVQWNDKSFTILFLGVLIKRKGVHDLLSAIDLLKKRELLKNTKFIIAGSGVEEENLKNQCGELKLNSYVEFVGWTEGEKKYNLLEKSQLLVLPSYNEGLPIAILEAMSYGLPIISTRVGDIESAVIDKKNGYLIEPGDISRLADAIGKIINNKQLYVDMSRYSRILAEEKFSDRKYFKMLKECYKL